MAFATAKGGRPHQRTTSPIRPKSAGAQGAKQPTAAAPRSRSPSVKGPTPKQNIRQSELGVNFESGNAGNNVVIQIFEKLHEKTGGMHSVQKGYTKGKCSRSKLRNLSTKPSEKILKNQSWKEFFSSTEISNDNSHASSSKERKRAETPDPKAIRSSVDSVNPDGGTTAAGRETELNYQLLYHRLVKRINHLWKELHIPLSDRDFYSVGIIKEQYQTINQIDDLSCYVKRLLDHRKDTIQVIQAIRDREHNVEQCNSLISVALRFYNLKYSTLHDDMARNIDKSDPAEVEHEQRLQCEIKSMILKLQQASCAVIRRIKAWREGLWRPQPFMYRGSNYIIKMKTDMNFLKSKSVSRILDAVPIEPHDLVCVLFEMDDERVSERMTHLK